MANVAKALKRDLDALRKGHTASYPLEEWYTRSAIEWGKRAVNIRVGERYEPIERPKFIYQCEYCDQVNEDRWYCWSCGGPANRDLIAQYLSAPRMAMSHGEWDRYKEDRKAAYKSLENWRI